MLQRYFAEILPSVIPFVITSSRVLQDVSPLVCTLQRHLCIFLQKRLPVAKFAGKTIVGKQAVIKNYWNHLILRYNMQGVLGLCFFRLDRC